MIPKIIHYCWFGEKTIPRQAQKYIAGWMRINPDYEIIQWNETNSPLKDNLYVQQAYQAKKWAFVSDYVRLKAISQYGGIYLDTDMELLRPLDAFLDNQVFFGFESPSKVATCIIGAVPHHLFLQKLLNLYQEMTFFNTNGTYNETTNVTYITMQLFALGVRADNIYQKSGEIVVYPSDFFSPFDLETGKITITPRTVAIHHFQGSWMTRRQRFHRKIAQLIGPDKTKKLKQYLMNNKG